MKSKAMGRIAALSFVTEDAYRAEWKEFETDVP